MGASIYKNKKPLFVFLLPAFLFMVVYLYYPFFRNIINSFQHIKNLRQITATWNDPWYTNYVELVQDPNVWTSIKNTLVMMLVTIVGQVGIALVLALLAAMGGLFEEGGFFPLIFLAAYLLIGGAVIVGVIKALLQRLDEIDGGEEEEASRY